MQAGSPGCLSKSRWQVFELQPLCHFRNPSSSYGEVIGKDKDPRFTVGYVGYSATTPVVYLRISASFLTAEEMGGDYYDYLQLSPTTFGIVIGDATGHEIPAGILVAMAKSCLHTLIRIDASVESVMQRMNEMVYETMKTMKRKLLMSFCYVILDTTNSTLTFSSAGHPPPYHYRQRIGKLDTLESFAYPLGVRRNIVYQAQKVQFQPGDIFIFYSDGIVEVENDKKEPFGYERLEQTIAESAPKIANVEELKSAILQKTYTYCHNLSFTDDATLVVLKILP